MLFVCIMFLFLPLILLAYLILFAALSNVVCLYNASFFAIDFANAFCVMLYGLCFMVY